MRSREHLAQRLRAVFERRPETPLLCDRNLALTGADCERRLVDLERTLAGAVPVGGTVGIWLPPSAAQAFAVVAVLACDRVPMVLDPWTLSPLPGGEGDSGLWGLITSAEALPRVALEVPVIVLDREVTVSGLHGSPMSRPPPALPQDAALMLRTSGSSGTPKSVVLSAQGLSYVVDLLIHRFALDATTVAAVTLPLHHTMGLNTHLLPTLLAGGRSVVYASGLRLGRAFRDFLDSGATFVSLVSDLLHLCLSEKRRRGLVAATAVTEMQLAGGMILAEHLKIARELFPNARLHKGYGLTEAIRVAMIDSDDQQFQDPGAGYVLPGQEVRIRDRQGRRLGPGMRGEIFVRGPNVMLGYAGSGGELEPGRELATGDLGHLTDDGRLVIEGRRDRIFKSYGHRIAAPEIERAALGCEAVAAAWCLPVSCSTRGQRPILFVELTPPELAANGHKAAVEASLRGRLEPYKIPKDIVLIDAVPRNSVGKVDLATLAQLWRERPATSEPERGPAGCRFTDLRRPSTSGRAT